MTVCPQCREGWGLDDPPTCVEPGHRHLQLEWHRHRSEVVLPGGVAVVAVSFDGADPYTRDVPPDYGLYLDDHWRPPWPHDHVHWPDFGAPADPDALGSALRAVVRAEPGPGNGSRSAATAGTAEPGPPLRAWQCSAAIHPTGRRLGAGELLQRRGGDR